MSAEIKLKTIDIFCGTGGVGKTTSATARAYHLASEGHAVLLMTIDPAKRLREVLHLEGKAAGVAHSVKHILPEDKQSQACFDALCIDPGTTLDHILEEQALNHFQSNRIVSILKRPYAGMNEMMALVELSRQIEKGCYDHVVLDTPPGQHFLDFLDGIARIEHFFDQSYVEIFQHLGKKLPTSPQSTVGKLFAGLAGKGVKKLLSYFESVTGATFLDEFIEVIQVFHALKDHFFKAHELQTKLKESHYSNWFLVTSAEHQKLHEALGLKSKAKTYIHDDSYLLLNKCLEDEFKNWNPSENTHPLWEELKNSYSKREQALKNFAKDHFPRSIEFAQINHIDPLRHVISLAAEWQKYAA